jgi:hypothetical protein
MRIIAEIKNMKVLDVTIDKNINWENFINLIRQLLNIEQQLGDNNV